MPLYTPRIPIYVTGTSPTFTSGAVSVNFAVDAANILSQRNGTVAQGFRVYNKYTDASNYERGIVDWNVTSNELVIGTESSGTGVLRTLRMTGGIIGFRTSGATRWQMDASGNFIAQTDNAVDIGASGASRPKNIYMSGLLTSGSATLHATTTALTDGSGAQAGTITNAPVAGNPTKWVPINDNGTTRYIPCW